MQTSDGTRLLTTYKSPLYNIDGSVMGTVGVGIDVTQERAYEDEIVEKNRTMETIFTTMDCGVITHSLDGTRLLGINQAALDILGYDSAEDLMAAGFDMVAPSVVDEDAGKMRESIATLKNVGDSVSTEYRVRHDNGDIVHVMGNVKLIESDGELLLQRYLLDYTDKKKEEVRKERRQRDLIQALSEDYLLVCSFSLDTKAARPCASAATGFASWTSCSPASSILTAASADTSMKLSWKRTRPCCATRFRRKASSRA